MPEYLSPGVYVEEIDTGSKPIEGVSTSTAGMLGMTERGPVNRPILVTSFGDYQRWFGGRLELEEFSDDGRAHCYLPHAVEGFFTNGGKRLYITRVLPEEATDSSLRLFDRGPDGAAETVLLRRAAENTGDAANPPAAYVLNPTGLAGLDWVRLGSGSRAEYRQVSSVGGSEHVAVDMPLGHAHNVGAALNVFTRAVNPPAAPFPELGEAVAAGASNMVVDEAAAALPVTVGDFVEIGPVDSAEYRRVLSVTALGGTLRRLTLDLPVHLDHPLAAPVVVVDSSAGATTSELLRLAVSAGDLLLFPDLPIGGYSAGDLLAIGTIGATDYELRRIGTMSTLQLARPAYSAYRAGTRVGHVNLADDGTYTPRSLTAEAAAGDMVISLDNRTGLDEGQVLRIGVNPDEEFVAIARLPADGTGPNDAGTVVLAFALRAGHDPGMNDVHPQTVGTGTHGPTTSILSVEEGTNEIVVTAGDGYVAGDFVRLTTPDGAVSYFRVDDRDPVTPGAVELEEPIALNHELGEPLVERAELLEVRALDEGAWGDRLRISVEDEESGLASRAEITDAPQPNEIRLTTITGVEPGSLLELIDRTTEEAIGTPVKARSVDRTDRRVRLDGDLSADQQAAIAAGAALNQPVRLRSREFRLTVRWMRRPDPAVPTRNEQVLETEVFRNLSMDPRHSRYVETIIGTTDGEPRLSDGRPEGDSWYVRVRDALEPAEAEAAIRPGPEALVDLLPSGRTQAARHALTGGSDSMATVTDETYVGEDDPSEPDDRTGLFTFLNVDRMSIIACPGQTTTTIQQALIDHCENFRYRFAVLDGPRPPGDTLTDVQAQRQQFDTKYAALYYPWLTIDDPFPDNLDVIDPYSIPPSGHMLGTYARVDESRGVHKAPANEVVRGITGLVRALRKGEHDILNPYPVNINVIRDFRPDNRGIRIWGARVITSDSDYKYVPVRRLLIFIEESIEIGLQWVVFEPNVEALWARVRRAISNFLTVVWRNGALEGTKVEEAFFVKCDRTTMTQTDIDNGRLICVIGVAPVKPAEFVIIRIGLWTATAEE